MKVFWGNFFTEFVGCSEVKARGINYCIVRAFVKVAYEVLDTLELWCRWISSIAIETVDGAHEIRVGTLHHM